MYYPLWMCHCYSSFPFHCLLTIYMFKYQSQIKIISAEFSADFFFCFCIWLCKLFLIPVHLGKGQWLARQIQFLQTKSQMSFLSLVSTSEYFSDDESDDSYYNLEESVFFEDIESDGKSFHFSFLLFTGIISNCIVYEFITYSQCHSPLLLHLISKW